MQSLLLPCGRQGQLFLEMAVCCSKQRTASSAGCLPAANSDLHACSTLVSPCAHEFERLRSTCQQAADTKVSCGTVGLAGLQWPLPPCLQQTKAAERLIAQESGLERDVGQNLMQMLGGQSDVLGKRRRSSAGSVDSDESALSGRWGPACSCFCLCLTRRCSEG